MALVLVTAGLMPLLAGEPPLLRKDVSSLTLSTAVGAPRAVLELVKEAPHAFIRMPAALPAAACEPLLAEVERVKSFGLAVTFVASGPGNGCTPAGTLRASKPCDALLQDAVTSASAFHALVVDATGIIRLHARFDPSLSAMRAAAAMLIAWEQGRQAFSVHCGHCHGDDGADIRSEAD